MLVNLNAMTKRSILKPLRALATKSAFLIPGFQKKWGRHAQACHGDAGKGETFYKKPAGRANRRG
jgi:hypothetical protein